MTPIKKQAIKNVAWLIAEYAGYSLLGIIGIVFLCWLIVTVIQWWIVPIWIVFMTVGKLLETINKETVRLESLQKHDDNDEIYDLSSQSPPMPTRDILEG